MRAPASARRRIFPASCSRSSPASTSPTCRFPAPVRRSRRSSRAPRRSRSLPPAHPHIVSGALKALAVTGTHRWFDLPDVPTMAELGYKDFVSDTFQGFLAPANTPAATVKQLTGKSLGIRKTPKIDEQLRNDGFEVIANGPDGMKKRIADEVPKWRDIITKAGIK